MRAVLQSPAAEQKETETRSALFHQLHTSICLIYPNKPCI